MFNALNRFISRLDGDGSAQKETPGSYGFQVLRNTNPDLAIEPWYDFVVGINGRMIDNPDPRLFAQEVRNCAGSTLSLGLWSAKGQRTRMLHVPVPSSASSPPAFAMPSSTLLGLTLQWTPLSVATNVWHVLDVPANSPADLAGLLPFGDYILGETPPADAAPTPLGGGTGSESGTSTPAPPSGGVGGSGAGGGYVLHGEAGLGELVEEHLGRPLRLWVYNNEYDVTRTVEVVPSRDWGGQGALGCVLGYGALHRLPAPLSEPVEAPGETMFDFGGAAAAGQSSYGAGGVGLDEAEAAGSAPSGDDAGLFVPAISVPNPAADFLVPAQLLPIGLPPTGVPPPSGAAAGGVASRGKKKERHAHHGPSSMMDDYFREEEKKSRELDSAPQGRTTPVPPPPKGAPPRANPVTTEPKAEGEED